MFCTYTSSPATDANIADIVFYSDKASDWVEYVPNPQLTILLGKDTVTDKVDWGQVAFDDSWGTETNPYEESKTLSFVTKDIEEDILLGLYEGKAFSLVHDRVAGKGGTASIQFSTDTKGTYAADGEDGDDVCPECGKNPCVCDRCHNEDHGDDNKGEDGEGDNNSDENNRSQNSYINTKYRCNYK